MEKQETNRVRIEIQVDKCMLFDGQYGCYYRVFCHDRAGNKYTFSSKFSYMAYQPWEWVEVEAQVSETFLHRPLKVVGGDEARRIGVPANNPRKWGFLIDLRKRDEYGWIEEIRPAEKCVTEDDVAFRAPALTPDQEAAMDEYYFE